MKTIWVVEQGSYSDYRVVGVFTSKKNAQVVVDAINRTDKYSEPTIAEWPLDPAVDAINKGYEQWRVLMLRDGTVEDTRKYGMVAYELGDAVHIWERTKAPAYKGKGFPDALNAWVWAKDKQHAVKIVNEMRAQWIAEGKWK